MGMMGALQSARATPVQIRRQRALIAAAVVVAAAGGLALTNPGPREFEDFAAQRLVELIDKELCQKPDLPLMLHLVMGNCAELVGAQRQTLGRLAHEHSRRLNLGIASLYSTRFGGQQLLPNWRVPNYSVTTIAAAGQFVVLQASATP